VILEDCKQKVLVLGVLTALFLEAIYVKELLYYINIRFFSY
jgi:hypothetical protein